MIKKIVLTGGPGSGKTTVVGEIVKTFEPQGVKVIFVDETATYFILKGIKPFGDGSIDIVDFQEIVMRMQLAKEEVFDRVAELYQNQDVLIIYDRGTLDNRAYLRSEKEFEDVLVRIMGVSNIAELMDKYDAVINLVGRKDFYTTENNAARSEDPDKALALGDATLKSWLGHKNIKIVEPKDRMEDKVNEVLNIINELLNKKQIKRQQKYLVDLKKTNLDYIKTNGRVAKIEQAYLMSEDNVEKRIRKIEIDGSNTYSFTIYKLDEKGNKSLVSEKVIDEKMYESLIGFKVDNSKVIHKERCYFSYGGEYLYLDLFDGDADLGIMETNVFLGDEILIPEFVHVIDIVTGKEEYSNRAIAIEKDKIRKELKND